MVRDPQELRTLVHGDTAQDRLVDAMLRLGSFGDGFGADPAGLSLQQLVDNPHGIDFGPLEPRLPGILRTRYAPGGNDSAACRPYDPARTRVLCSCERERLRSELAPGAFETQSRTIS